MDEKSRQFKSPYNWEYLHIILYVKFFHKTGGLYIKLLKMLMLWSDNKKKFNKKLTKYKFLLNFGFSILA